MTIRIYEDGDNVLIRTPGADIETTRTEALALADAIRERFAPALAGPGDRPSHARWTPEEDAELRRLYVDERWPPRKIAAALGRGKAGIHKRLRRLGVSGNNPKMVEIGRRLAALKAARLAAE